jgi:hypothetical protein
VFNTNFSSISAINSKKKNAKIKNKIKKNAKTFLRMYRYFVSVFTVNKASVQKLLPGFKL